MSDAHKAAARRRQGRQALVPLDVAAPRKAFVELIHIDVSGDNGRKQRTAVDLRAADPPANRVPCPGDSARRNVDGSVCASPFFEKIVRTSFPRRHLLGKVAIQQTFSQYQRVAQTLGERKTGMQAMGNFKKRGQNRMSLAGGLRMRKKISPHLTAAEFYLAGRGNFRVLRTPMRSQRLRSK